MKFQIILCLAFVLSGGLFGCATKPEPKNYLEDYLTNLNFKSYLTNCGTNQIRCVWFENNLPNLGEVMTFYLRDEMVFTASDDYDNEMKNGSIRDDDTRKLTHPQMLNLEKIIKFRRICDFGRCFQHPNRHEPARFGS
jgi:hypothetical protein